MYVCVYQLFSCDFFCLVFIVLHLDLLSHTFVMRKVGYVTQVGGRFGGIFGGVLCPSLA